MPQKTCIVIAVNPFIYLSQTRLFAVGLFPKQRLCLVFPELQRVVPRPQPLVHRQLPPLSPHLLPLHSPKVTPPTNSYNQKVENIAIKMFIVKHYLFVTVVAPIQMVITEK